MWALLAGLALAANPVDRPVCDPIVPVDVRGRRFFSSRSELPPDGPWCLRMDTPGTGHIFVEFVPLSRAPSRWTVQIWTDTGRLLTSVNIEDVTNERIFHTMNPRVGSGHDDVLVVVTGSGKAFELGASFNPLPPTLHRLLLPDGDPARLVSRGQSLVLEGDAFEDHPDTFLYVGGIPVDPDRIEPTRISFRVPARAQERWLVVQGPNGGSEKLALPLVDPDPLPPAKIATALAVGRVAIGLVVDPHWRTAEIERRVDDSLFDCGQDLDWSIEGYLQAINSYSIHLEVPPGWEPQAFGRSMVPCLGRYFNQGVTLVAW